MKTFRRFWHIPACLFLLLLLLSGARAEGPLYPCEINRFGAGLQPKFGTINDYDIAPLHIGWYSDWTVKLNPPRPNGIEYAQLIWVNDGAFSPSLGQLGPMVDANPGSLWMIGNEPECVWQGNNTPAQYAQVYHLLHGFIKGRDPTAQLAVGGVVQPTPLRLEWLDLVLNHYQATYGEPMPVDVWNIHIQILQELRDSWGCDIPRGLPHESGRLYGVQDNDNIEVFQQLIVEFRTWMRDRGQRDKPLIISEYGILMPVEYGFTPERVNAFMDASFDYLLTARDTALGHPADENRLVQRWLWYSLNEQPYDLFTGQGYNGPLFDYRYPQYPGVLTEHGVNFKEYTDALLESTVTLQQGMDGYTGSEDTYIYQYQPDTNHCGQNALTVGNKQRYATLLRFDLSSIPADSTVTEAVLQVYATGWGGSDMTVDAYRILRDASMCQATWNQAASGNVWGIAGCNDMVTDRGTVPESSVDTTGINKWYSLDLTALVQQWMDGDLENNGVLLRGASALSSNQFYFASSEHGTPSLRPRLVVTIQGPCVPMPTATVTATATRTPTPTPTASSTPAQTSTAVESPTPTATPTHAPTATATSPATHTPSATPSATATPVSTETTVTLQQNVDGYTGSEDAYIYQYEPDTNHCWDSTLRVGYKQRYAAVLRFDLSSIPSNSTVTEASLKVYAKGWSGSDMTVDAFRILRDVNMCQVTWNRAASGNVWAVAGCNDTVTDRGAVPESSVDTTGINKWYSLDLTALVGAWVNGSVANNGVLLRGASSLSSNQFYWASAEDSLTSRHPKLVITYRAASEPTPSATATAAPTRTPTPTPTASSTPAQTSTVVESPTPTATSPATHTATAAPSATATAASTETTVTLQQGVGGYTGAEDTYIYQYEPDTNHCWDNTLRVGYKQRYAALLRFDLSFIPANSTVTEASLEVYAKGWSGSDMTVDAYRILRDVNICQATWNQAASDNVWGVAGCNDTMTDRGAVPESSVDTTGINRWYSFDLTALVQAWVNGSVGNNGVLLRGTSPLSSDQFYWASAEDDLTSRRPKLIITYRGGGGSGSQHTATGLRLAAQPYQGMRVDHRLSGHPAIRRNLLRE